MAFFKWSSGISEVYKPEGGLLPGMIGKSGWKLVITRQAKKGKTIEFGTALEEVAGDTGTIAVQAISATEDTLGAAETREILGIAVYDAVGQQTRVVGSPQIISTYPTEYNISVLRKGAIFVPVQIGAPAIGGAVWIKLVANATKTYLPVGGFEAAQDLTGSGETLVHYNVKVTNAKFASGAMSPLSYTGLADASHETGRVALVEFDM